MSAAQDPSELWGSATSASGTYPLFEKETITKDFRLKEITSWKFFLVRRLMFLF